MKEFVEFCCSLILLLKGRTKQAKALKTFWNECYSGFQLSKQPPPYSWALEGDVSCGLVCGRVARSHQPVASLFSAKEEEKGWNELCLILCVYVLFFFFNFLACFHSWFPVSVFLQLGHNPPLFLEMGLALSRACHKIECSTSLVRPLWAAVRNNILPVLCRAFRLAGDLRASISLR